MRVLIQRVKYSSCTIDDKVTGKTDKGFMLLIGFKTTDTLAELEKCQKKVFGMRVFEDENGKMNKSLLDVGGSTLAISQFTLYADCKRGNRPGFTDAMEFNKASEYYYLFVKMLRDSGLHVETGIFGADMKIELLNDGPVTILLDTDDL
jgi:D-tyrosyl-tRNA(Tyr) deacylase